MLPQLLDQLISLCETARYLSQPLGGNGHRPDKAAELIQNLTREEGTTVVIVEHNMRVIFDICDRIVVLNAGKKIADGVPQEIRENKEVIAAYLGGGIDAAQH